jgi:hypothetical protein
MKLLLLEIIYNRRRSTKQARLGFGIDRVLIKKRSVNTFILTSDRVSKELSAKSLSESRECIIEVYQ